MAGAALLVGLAAGVTPSPVSATPRPASTASPTNPQFKFSAEPYSAPGTQQRSEYTYQLQPGHQILDQVAILNSSNSPESFLIYGEDATSVSSTSGYAFEARSKMRNTTVGRWLTVGHTYLTVPVGKKVVETFQLAIPSNAPPGDHVGGIVVEELKSQADQTKGGGVSLVLRVAIPMYVHVVGPSYPGLTIEKLTVLHQSPAFPYLNGTKVAVSLVLVNTGNIILDPQSVTVSITGALSGTIHRYTVHQTGAPQSRTNPLPLQMLPGGKLVLTEEWSGIPPFDPLTGHVSATAIDASTTAKISTGASAAFWYFPWIVVLILLVLVAGLIALIVFRRRRRAAGSGASPDQGDDSGGGTGTLRPSTSDRSALEQARR